jgi:hypothetical protein
MEPKVPAARMPSMLRSPRAAAKPAMGMKLIYGLALFRTGNGIALDAGHVGVAP